jgi:hypothetical protein
MFPGDMVAEGAASPFSAAILNANLNADDYAVARVWICWNVRDAGLLDGVLPGSILGPDGKIALPHGPAHCHAVEGAVAAAIITAGADTFPLLIPVPPAMPGGSARPDPADWGQVAGGPFCQAAFVARLRRWLAIHLPGVCVAHFGAMPQVFADRAATAGAAGAGGAGPATPASVPVTVTVSRPLSESQHAEHRAGTLVNEGELRTQLANSHSETSLFATGVFSYNAEHRPIALYCGYQVPDTTAGAAHGSFIWRSPPDEMIPLLFGRSTHAPPAASMEHYLLQLATTVTKAAVMKAQSFIDMAILPVGDALRQGLAACVSWGNHSCIVFLLRRFHLGGHRGSSRPHVPLRARRSTRAGSAHLGP